MIVVVSAARVFPAFLIAAFPRLPTGRDQMP